MDKKVYHICFKHETGEAKILEGASVICSAERAINLYEEELEKYKVFVDAANLSLLLHRDRLMLHNPVIAARREFFKNKTKFKNDGFLNIIEKLETLSFLTGDVHAIEIYDKAAFLESKMKEYTNEIHIANPNTDTSEFLYKKALEDKENEAKKYLTRRESMDICKKVEIPAITVKCDCGKEYKIEGYFKITE